MHVSTPQPFTQCLGMRLFQQQRQYLQCLVRRLHARRVEWIGDAFWSFRVPKMPRLRSLLAAGLTLTSLPVWAVQPINNSTTGDQQKVAIAAVTSGTLAGDFVAVWATDQAAVTARVFEGDTGVAQTAEIAIGFSVLGAPAVAINSSGKYVVVWSEAVLGGSVIRGRFCSAASCGGTFNVSTLAGWNTSPTVTLRDNSEFAVFWEGPLGTIKARLFTSAILSASGSTELTASHATAAAPSAAVVLGGATDYTYALAYEAQDSAGSGVFFRTVSATGTFAAAQQVNTTTLGAQNKPRLACAASGTCAMTWEGPDNSASRDIFVRVLATNLMSWGAESIANVVTSGDQSAPAIAASASGNYDLAWVSTSDGSALRGAPIFIRGRRLGGGPPALGAPTEFTVASGLVNLPAVGARWGGFTVAWESYSDGDGMGVVSERVNLP